MTLAVVALGANLGNPKKNVLMSFEKLKKLGCEFQASFLYWTKPKSTIPQPDFLNGVCCFKTDFLPLDLFSSLEEIEKEIGKEKKAKDAPRTIDLDLLFYGKQMFVKEGLIIPHLNWKERLFVLIPLLDLFQEIEVEGEKWNIKEMIEGFSKEEQSEVWCESSSG